MTYPEISQHQEFINIGRPDDYPVHTFTFIKEKNIFVYRDRLCIKAVSAICTHLGCVLQKSTSGFRCPCHGSQYNIQGGVMSGPAPRDMDWLQVRFNHNGDLIVSRHKKVSPETELVL
jgi:cytochrome b6-f complex iron-sulfur subunit